MPLFLGSLFKCLVYIFSCNHGYGLWIILFSHLKPCLFLEVEVEVEEIERAREAAVVVMVSMAVVVAECRTIISCITCGS